MSQIQGASQHFSENSGAGPAHGDPDSDGHHHQCEYGMLLLAAYLLKILLAILNHYIPKNVLGLFKTSMNHFN